MKLISFIVRVFANAKIRAKIRIENGKQSQGTPCFFYFFPLRTKRVIHPILFVLVINELHFTIYYSPTHGTIYIVTVLVHIIFLILVNVFLPAPSAKHVFAIIQ